MILENIIDELFNIAINIGYNNISYFHPLLAAKRGQLPSDRLTAIVKPLKQKITNGIPLNNAELTVALNDLKKIDKDYKIKELKKPIAELKAYLDTLG